MKSKAKTNISAELGNIRRRLGLETLDDALFFPKYFEIETIRACNARCLMCTVNDWKDRNSRMDDRLFEKIVRELEKYSGWINSVCLSRNGEPLLDRNIAEKVAALKKAGIREVTFSTNASLLTQEKAIELLRAGIDIVTFSMDSVDKKTFESIRAGLSYEKVLGNCLNFIRLRSAENSHTRVRIRMILQDKNRGQEQAFAQFWKGKLGKNDSVYSKKLHSWGNQLPGNKAARHAAGFILPCISPWSTVVIHFDGTVPMCGCDFNNKKIIGNVRKTSIQKIWQSRRMNEIRMLHASGERNRLPLCIGCRIWDVDKRKAYVGSP